MNLQVNSPYTKCPYRCPFCVAGVTDQTQYPFSDTFWKEHQGEYLYRLEEIIRKFNIDTMVITGSTEPTLFTPWIIAVTTVASHLVKSIEIQTRNYGYTGMRGIDLIAYSHDHIPVYNRIKLPYHTTQRDVFIWSKNLSAINIVDYFNLHRDVIDQTTVKQLVKNSYGNESIDKYIESIWSPIAEDDELLLTSAGIRVDKACNESEGRYIIYRTDGNVYQRWSDTTPVNIGK